MSKQQFYGMCMTFRCSNIICMILDAETLFVCFYYKVVIITRITTMACIWFLDVVALFVYFYSKGFYH